MNTVAWHLEHSVEAEVSASFAWTFWTDVSNWNDPPAQFELDGPFVVGSGGRTLLPDREPLQWRIREVSARVRAAIEMQLHGAILTFEWRFQPLSKHRTRLTQRIALSGDNATAYAGEAQAGFGADLPEGMKRVAKAMEACEKRSERAG